MKLNRWIAVPILVATGLAALGSATTQAQVVLQPNFQPNPQTLSSGVSGGSGGTECGTLPAAPSAVVQLAADITSMRFIVQGDGQPTLMIQGPQGKSCILSDNLSGGVLEVPGYWEQGTYSLYVGDRAGGSHNYTLSVSR
ncbi:MAG: hypothetical protein F6K32_12835 [Desertifilum sp. SIO1I2]|nr:hypothetical protein [Desertifilum sp. SIO1I2]